MTNYEKQMSEMTLERMAELLIQTEIEDEGDYDMDDNWQSWYMENYVTPLGSRYMDYSGALEETIDWLSKEAEQ